MVFRQVSDAFMRLHVADQDRACRLLVAMDQEVSPLGMAVSQNAIMRARQADLAPPEEGKPSQRQEFPPRTGAAKPVRAHRLSSSAGFLCLGFLRSDFGWM